MTSQSLVSPSVKWADNPHLTVYHMGKTNKLAGARASRRRGEKWDWKERHSQVPKSCEDHIRASGLYPVELG